MRLALLGLAFLAMMALAAMLIGPLERRFIFFPTREVADTPDRLGLTFEDVYFTTEDGVRLNGWYIPGSQGTTWLWFHGNGGDIGHRVPELGLLHQRLGVNQFIFDYRGYGRSRGKPSEQGTYRDARAALHYLQGRDDVAPDKIVYFGRSLGAAVAVELATTQPPLGLVLVSPFASMSDMAHLAFPFLPVHLLVRHKYNSIPRIQRIQRPLLVLHGDRDDTVPLSQGRKLFEAANPPKQFCTMPGAGHNNSLASAGLDCWETLASFPHLMDEQG